MSPHEFIAGPGVFATPPRCACGKDVGDPIHVVEEPKAAAPSPALEADLGSPGTRPRLPNERVMNVYLLYNGSYSDRQLLGVFRALKTAKVQGEAFRRAPWAIHAHVWTESPPSAWEDVRSWSCEQYDEFESEPGASVYPNKYHFVCELGIEERPLVEEPWLTTNPSWYTAPRISKPERD